MNIAFAVFMVIWGYLVFSPKVHRKGEAKVEKHDTDTIKNNP